MIGASQILAELDRIYHNPAPEEENVDKTVEAQAQSLQDFIAQNRGNILLFDKPTQDQIQQKLSAHKTCLFAMSQMLSLMSTAGHPLDSAFTVDAYLGDLEGQSKSTERKMHAAAEKMLEDPSYVPPIDSAVGNEFTQQNNQLRTKIENCIQSIDQLTFDIQAQRSWRWSCAVL